MSGPDPYKILQVDPEAEDEVIAAAYRRLARKYHPDTAMAPDALARMSAINAAWERLRQPAGRAAVDRERAIQAALARAGNGSPAAPGPSQRPAGPSQRTGAPPPPRPSEPETVSRDWSSGRSSVGGGYDPSMRRADGDGAAGTPPGDPSGSVLTFGRYAGWSLGEVARADLEFLEWLDRMPIGRPYRDEIDALLRRAGRRRTTQAEDTDRRGLFRRR